METNPFVSIIMPTYNRAFIMGKAIQSVLTQTFKNFELIIIDDGSTDNTSELISDYNDGRVKYIGLDVNKGGNFARNIGMKEAKGKYIAFLDSDNQWENDYLEKRMVLLHGESHPIISFGRIQIIKEGRDNQIFPPESSSAFDNREKLLRIMLLKNVMDTNTVVLSRDCFGIEKGFDLEFSRLQDWDFFIGLISDEHNKILFEDRISVRHYTLSDSITNRKELYLPNRFRLVKKYEWLLERLNMKSEIQRRLTEEIQAEGDYGRAYEIAKTMRDKQLMDYVINAIIYGADREKEATNILKKVLRLSEDTSGIRRFFSDMRYKDVAIYGNGFLGKYIIGIIKEINSINLKCVIDRENYDHFENGVHYVNNSDYIDGIDVIIVTLLNDSREVVKSMSSIYNIPIFSLEDII